MRVSIQETNFHDLINQIKARKMAKRSRTPNCTHLDMDRVYGRKQQCHVCGHPPSMGFLYECRQDCDAKSLRNLILEGDEDENHVEAAKSDMRLQLEWLGLSESIITTAELGDYTAVQLETLKGQKKDLRQIISDSLQVTHINHAVAKLAAIAQTPSSYDGAHSSTMNKDTAPLGCTFKACHTCRPYYRDRTYISFQAVLNAEFTPMTRGQIDILPTKSAQTMKTIGNLTQSFPSFSSSLPTSTSRAPSIDAPPTAATSTSSASDLTFKTTQTDLDVISAQRRPHRRFYKMGHRNLGDIARDLSRQSTMLTRHGLRIALQSIFRSNRDSSSSRSNITLPVPRTGTVRNSSKAQHVGDFDLPALRKVRKEKERIERKKGTYMIGHEDVPTHQGEVNASATGSAHNEHIAHEASSFEESNVSMHLCASEGSEVMVDGGVALTEEAVRTHTPDILAVDFPALKHAAVVHDVEMGEDDDVDADIGLQSIMTQA